MKRIWSIVLFLFILSNAYSDELSPMKQVSDEGGQVWLDQITAWLETKEDSFALNDSRYSLSQKKEEVEDAFGNDSWLVFKAEDKKGICDLWWYLRQDSKGRLLAQLRFKNRSQKPLHIIRIVVLKGLRLGNWQGGRLLDGNLLSGDGGTSLLQASVQVKTAFAVATNRPSLAGGFLTSSHYRGDIYIKPVKGALEIIAENDGEGVRLAPGEVRESDWLWLSPGKNPSTELERWAATAGGMNNVQRWSKNFATWCSWYAGSIFQNNTGGALEQRARRNTTIIAKEFLPFGLSCARLVDDSLERNAGDWNMVTSALPNGYPAIADFIRKHSLQAGFWYESHRVQTSSVIFKKHPEWLAIAQDGKPQLAGDGSPYGTYGVFDASLPQVRQYLQKASSKFRKAGFRYCFLDFIFEAPVGPDQSHNPEMTGIEEARLLFGAIRKGLGKDCYFLFAPILAGSYGYADAMRINGDSWGHYPLAYVNCLTRWFLNHNLFLADPDAWLPTSHSLRWDRDWGSWLSLYGGPMTIGADLCDIPSQRTALIKRILPALNSPGRPRDIWERTIPIILEQQLSVGSEHWRVVGLFNYGRATPIDIKLNLDRLWDEKGYPEQGFAATANVLGKTDRRFLIYDFWQDRFLGEFDGTADFRIDGNRAKVIVVREAKKRPQILALGTHIGQGIEELRATRWDGHNKILYGTTQGRAGCEDTKVLLHIPKGMKVAKASVAGQLVDWKTAGDVCRFVVPDHAGEKKWQVSFEGKISTLAKSARSREPGLLVELHQACTSNGGINGGMMAWDKNFDTIANKIVPKGWQAVFYAHPEGPVFPYDRYSQLQGFGLVSGKRLYDKALDAFVSHGSAYMDDSRICYRIDGMPAGKVYRAGFVLVDPNNKGRSADIVIKNVSGVETLIAKNVNYTSKDTAEDGKVMWLDLPNGLVDPAGFEFEVRKRTGPNVICAEFWLIQQIQ